MKTTRVLASLSLATSLVAQARAGVLLQDDFAGPDGPVDASKWTAYATFGTAPVQSGGQAVLDQRGTLVTNAGFNPTMPGGLMVAASFTITPYTAEQLQMLPPDWPYPDPGDIAMITTRANPSGTGPAMTPRDGVFAAFWEHENLLQLFQQVNGVEQNKLEIYFDSDDASGNANDLNGITAGSTVRLSFWDDGTNVSATVIHLSGPGSGSGSGSSTFSVNTGFDRVSLFNRENATTYLDDVVISTPAPEPASAVLLLSGGAHFAMRRRR